jgi:hypothetical protein
LRKRFRKTAGLGVILVAGAVAMGAHAFTATNTVPASKAGNGSGAISGFAVSNIAYTNTGDKITAVTFDLDGAAADVMVQLIPTTGTWYDCGASGASTPFAVTCTTNDDATSATQLSVVAHQ